LLRITKVKDILDPHKILVKTTYEEPVSDLLKKMAQAKIQSAIVVDKGVGGAGIFGFVDVLDILCHALEVARNSKDLQTETIENLKWEGKVFSWQNVGSIANISRLNPLDVVSSNDSLLDVTKKMAAGQHRLAVVDNNSLTNIISQSDLIRFLTTRALHINNKIGKPLNQSGLSPLGVSSVRWDVLTIDAIRYMRDYKASGVPVVNLEGKIIANFSASDLLELDEKKFSLLATPVYEYLVRTRGSTTPPIVVRPFDTVETMLLKCVVNSVHRVYIVDEDVKPIGVITLTDILAWILATAASSE